MKSLNWYDCEIERFIETYNLMMFNSFQVYCAIIVMWWSVNSWSNYANENNTFNLAFLLIRTFWLSAPFQPIRMLERKARFSEFQFSEESENFLCFPSKRWNLRNFVKKFFPLFSISTEWMHFTAWYSQSIKATVCCNILNISFTN